MMYKKKEDLFNSEGGIVQRVLICQTALDGIREYMNTPHTDISQNDIFVSNALEVALSAYKDELEQYGFIHNGK